MNSKHSSLVGTIICIFKHFEQPFANKQQLATLNIETTTTYGENGRHETGKTLILSLPPKCFTIMNAPLLKEVTIPASSTTKFTNNGTYSDMIKVSINHHQPISSVWSSRLYQTSHHQLQKRRSRKNLARS